MTTTITGIEIKDTIVHGNLIISGVTVQNITQMPAPPPLWVNVPILPREFVGRDELVAGLVARLLAGQSTAAEGLAGVGKTALAVVLAHHPAVLAHFTDGVLWAGLGPQGDAMSALTAWGNALGVDVTDQPTVQLRSQAVRNAIGQRRLLLVIDDAWDLGAAEPLRCGGPGCEHLLTTRDQGLARAFAGVRNQVAVPELEEDPALDLLRRLAPRSLFAELSAEAWGVMSDPGQRLRLATVRLGAVDGRQVTLQETIALSLEHLPKTTVEAFYALGAFAPKPATFDLEAAKTVIETSTKPGVWRKLAEMLRPAAAKTPAATSAANLATLIARSLVEQAGPETLALHRTIADVARTALPADAVERHRDYYLAVVDEDREDWERIGGVYPQVMQAWQWQVERWPDDRRLLDFFGSLRIYQERQGLWADYAGQAGQCLTWTQTHQDQRNAALSLNAMGYMHNALGDQQQALAHFEQALPLYRQVGDQEGEATTLNNIGMVYVALGHQQQALAYLGQALPLRRQAGDRGGEATTLNNIGAAYNALGDKQQALAYYEQALPIRRQMGDRVGEATTLNNIGQVYADLGDKQQALVYCEQALPLFRQVGDRRSEAALLTNIGRVYSDLGDKQQALAYYERALPIQRQVGDRGGEAGTLNNIGRVYSALGDQQQAYRYYEQALPLDRQAGDRRGEATTLTNIGAAHAAEGDQPQALIYYEQALTLFRQAGDRSREATTLGNIGAAHAALGDKQQALAYYDQALPLVRQVGDRSGEATTLHNIGFVYAALGDQQLALAYYQQALPLRRQVGDRGGEAATLTNIGRVYSDLGNKQQALVYFEQALPLFRQVGDRWGENVARSNVAKVNEALGDLAGAEEQLRQVVAIDEAIGHPDLESDRAELARIQRLRHARHS